MQSFPVAAESSEARRELRRGRHQEGKERPDLLADDQIADFRHPQSRHILVAHPEDLHTPTPAEPAWIKSELSYVQVHAAVVHEYACEDATPDRQP
jgi:hypothetical protein